MKTWEEEGKQRIKEDGFLTKVWIEGNKKKILFLTFCCFVLLLMLDARGT